MSARPRIAITGPDGFVAWHTRCAARARWGGDLIGIGPDEYSDPTALDACIGEADAVIHLAGVNRSVDESEILTVNPLLAQKLADSLERLGRRIPVVYGNSIHSEGGSAFGVAKQRAADILTTWGQRVDAPVMDVVMPNIFGEHGVPHYNSVVATFCHQLARGESPTVVDDKEIPLIHAQRIAGRLLDLAVNPEPGRIPIQGTPKYVGELLMELDHMAAQYRSGILPDLSDEFTRELFNTYRASTFPRLWPIHPPAKSDERGALVEALKAMGGQSQVFFSSTGPGFTRGQHYHLHKVERFLVLRGTGEIRLRRLFSTEVVRFPVSGDTPAIIDMPTMWAHSITNTGDDDLTTLFYADEVFDPDRPDTFAEEV